jgi:hypothetical protein
MKSQIDHVLIDGRHASDVLNVRTYRYRAEDIEHHDSYHFYVEATIRARLSNVFEKKGTKSRQIDVAQLQINEKRKKISEKLNQKTEQDEFGGHSVERCERRLKFEDVLKAQAPERNEWFDDECREAVRAVIDSRGSGRSTRQQEESASKKQEEVVQNEEKTVRPAETV